MALFRFLCAFCVLSTAWSLKTDDVALIQKDSRPKKVAEPEPEVIAPVDPVQKLLGGNYTIQMFSNTMEQLHPALQDITFTEAFSHVNNRIQQSFKRYEEFALCSSHSKCMSFARAWKMLTPEEFVPALATALAEHNIEMKRLVMDLQGAEKEIIHVMPSKLRLAVYPLLQEMVPDSVPFTVPLQLAEGGASGACDMLRPLLQNVSSLSKRMHKLKSMVNATQQNLPMLSTIMPDMSEDVSAFLHQVLNLANLGSVGLSQVSDSANKYIVEQIKYKLPCLRDNATLPSQSAAAARAPFALLVGVACAAAGLLRW